MCTVTVASIGDMLRVAFNRDERRQRRAAHPPFITRAGALQVLMPQDAQGRGTWIAANTAGLVFTLLNAHTGRVESGPRRVSRGLVIPALADCASLEQTAARATDLSASDYAPFRLLAMQGREVIELSTVQGAWRASTRSVSQPLLFTSSSLGDALVEGPRRALFEQMFATRGDLAALQDAFHAHRWRDRPALSVHMSRPDACTVSTTIVEVTNTEVRMVYQPAHCDAGTPVGLAIERHDAGRVSSVWPGREHAAV